MTIGATPSSRVTVVVKLPLESNGTEIPCTVTVARPEPPASVALPATVTGPVGRNAPRAGCVIVTAGGVRSRPEPPALVLAATDMPAEPDPPPLALLPQPEAAPSAVASSARPSARVMGATTDHWLTWATGVSTA